jgi:hypothetical protein
MKVGRGEGGDNKKLKRKVLSNSEAAIFGQTGWFVSERYIPAQQISES